MMNLKDFGMGKTEFEDKIIEECHYLMEAFKQFKGKRWMTDRNCNFLIQINFL